MWGTSFQRLQHRIRSRVCILVISIIRKNHKDILQSNLHVICSNRFDVPLSRRANPNAENACLVVGCVGDIVASMIMVTLVSNEIHPITDYFEFPLDRTQFS